jgi:hypothetical protein
MSCAGALPGQHSESTSNKPIRVNLMSHSLRQAGANRIARGGAVPLANEYGSPREVPQSKCKLMTSGLAAVKINF